MNFSPKCNTKSDIGRFFIKFGNFCLLGKKRGPITVPKFGLGNSLVTQTQYSHLPSAEGFYWVLLKTGKYFATEKDRKELSGTEKDFDMACYAIKTYVK